VRSVVVDPRGGAAPTVLTGASTRTTDFSVARSLDGGATWGPTIGFPAFDSAFRLTVPVVRFDPLQPGRVYAGTSGSQSFSVPWPVGVGAGVYRSDDDGATWRQFANGLPLHPFVANRIENVWALAVDPLVSGRLWAAADVSDPMDVAPPASAVYRSSNAGSSWQACGSLNSSNWIYRLAAAPLQRDVVIALAIDLTRSGGEVWISRDACATWQPYDAGELVDPRGLAIDGNRVYVGHANGVSVRLLDEALLLSDGFES
jgi:hypothetical protein